MKKTTSKPRVSGDPTRKKIIKAARALFVKHGFHGTSMSAIAKKSKVNQSLIFHHFDNKQSLWKTVKLSFLCQEDTTKLKLPPAKRGLKAFLSHVIKWRIEFSSRHPGVVRILNWQHLEPVKQQLTGTNTQLPVAPLQWIPLIEELQKNGEINAKLHPKLIISFIRGATEGCINDEELLKDSQKRKAYTQMIIKGLTLALAAAKS